MISRATWLFVGLCCAPSVNAVAQQPAPAESTRLGGLFAEPPHHAAASGPEAQLTDIEQKLDALAQRGDAAVAAAAIEQGRRAIAAARAAFARRDRERGERAQQIAWAALSLASRRIAAADAALANSRAAQREQDALAARTVAQQALAEAKLRLSALRARAPR